MKYFVLLTFLSLSVLSNAFISRSLLRNNRLSMSLSTSTVDGPKSLLLNNEYKSRMEINELVLKLEKINPTPNPAQSPLINGVWELVLNGVTDPSLLIYQAVKLIPGSIIGASPVTVTISSVSPRVKASSTINIGRLKQNIDVVHDLEAISGSTLKETYSACKLANIDIPLGSLPLPSGLLTRELIVSYLDDDILIVRDFLGSPEMLKRVDFYQQNAMSSSTDDDVPSA